MRRSWRRFLKRRQKLFITLSLFSLANIIYPQHAVASDVSAEVAEKPGVIIDEPVKLVEQRSESGQLLPVVQSLPTKRTLHVVATAYSSSRDETDGDPFTTASGAKTRDGVIAANGLPFGTRLRIPDVYGDKIFMVLDRMSARYGRNRIDIWMPTKQAAKEWGVKYVRMEIL